jgi:N6-L-threonylcarbamoyladenine synthase
MKQNKNNPTILAIDTSCDDTSVAVTQSLTVLSNVVASQTQLHQQYGGVFPTVAKQAHLENIDPCIKLALKRAGLKWEQIDAIAVTQGPGLAPALEIGVEKAKALALEFKKPLIAVNHIEGHMLSVLAQPKTKKSNFELLSSSLPILSIIVSGGHTEFILVKDIGDYEILGQTVDDAAGECLDKVGRMLDLGYPAGPVIEQFAKLGNPFAYEFPLPMTESHDFNLSYSGLKTHARNLIEGLTQTKPLNQQQVYDLSASIQYAVFRHICYKLNKIIIKHPNLGQFWLGGGVSANATLRKMLRETIKKHLPQTKLLTPYSKKLCADNAAMIGIVGNFKFEKNKVVSNISALERQPKLVLSYLPT